MERSAPNESQVSVVIHHGKHNHGSYQLVEEKEF